MVAGPIGVGCRDVIKEVKKFVSKLPLISAVGCLYINVYTLIALIAMSGRSKDLNEASYISANIRLFYNGL